MFPDCGLSLGSIANLFKGCCSGSDAKGKYPQPRMINCCVFGGVRQVVYVIERDMEEGVEFTSDDLNIKMEKEDKSAN